MSRASPPGAPSSPDSPWASYLNLGDKTQLASALFATEYDPLMVLAGVMIALFILNLMAIFLGRYLSRRIDRKLMSRVAGGIFLLIGFSFLISALASSAW